MKMTIKNHHFYTIFKTLSYTCLMACGLYFSKDALYQYKERKTAFQTTIHTLTLDDLPYITICYEGLQYSIYQELRFNSAIAEDWTMSYLAEIVISNEESSSDRFYFVDEHSFADDSSTNGTFIRKRMYDGLYMWTMCDCFIFNTEEIRKITTSAEVAQLHFDFVIDFGNSSKFKPIHPVAYVSSGANVFGAVDRWYEGKVDRIEIGRNVKSVHISNIRETIWSGGCSKKSYHETLAEQYFKKDFSSSNLEYSDLKSQSDMMFPCPKMYKCIGKTLTFNYPTCNLSHLQTAEQNKGPDIIDLLYCSQEALQVVRDEMKKSLGKSSKSCVTKEFLVDQIQEHGPHKTEFHFFKHLVPSNKDKKNNGFGLILQMDGFANNLWTGQVTKTVHREYFVMSDIGLIGTVGGTLGLFVGLSFTGCGAVMMSMIKNALSGMVKRNTHPKGRQIGLP